MFKKMIERSALKKIHPYYEIDGWLTEREALGLFLTARKLRRDAVVVEIGSWQGKSTYCISRGLRSGKIYAIDPFNADAGFDQGSRKEYAEKGATTDLLIRFTENMERLSVHDKIIVKKGYSYEMHNDFQQIDFLFIDGDHSIAGCRSDFELYASKVVRGGYIAFHDYYPDRDELGPTYVIQNLAGDHFNFSRQYDSLWIGKKR
ncbi:class I SAM-dependent methyltransferase [Chitinophaga sp. RCC_12]